ncbi:MAG: hypothetical protein K2X66_18845 [Cyanobacteria bacterium]|nr:hypothetical protein [Cyanobacteriota bacterium]
MPTSNSLVSGVKKLLKLFSVGLLGSLPLTVASPIAKAQDMSAVYIATAAATMDTGSSTPSTPKTEESKVLHIQVHPLAAPFAILYGIFGLATIHLCFKKLKNTSQTNPPPGKPKIS